MNKRRALGRGLDALLSKPISPAMLSANGDAELRAIPVELVRRGRYQPRSRIDQDALEELANSIRAQGVVQPIVVRPEDDGKHFEIIAGERRWRACQLAGLAEVPAVVRQTADEDAVAIALIENVQRQDLTPLEEARALQRLVKEFELTHQAAAEAVGRSRAAVSNLLRLLDLNAEVKNLMEEGELDMGHGRALLALSGPEQTQAAQSVVARGLSARQTEALVRSLQAGKGGKTGGGKGEKSLDPNVRRLQDELSERLGASVSIQQKSAAKGRLIIEYSSLDQLDGILERIK